jgi:hypothetical protein
MKTAKFIITTFVLTSVLWGGKMDEHIFYQNVMSSVLSVVVESRSVMDQCMVEIFSCDRERYLLITIAKNDGNYYNLYKLSENGMVSSEIKYSLLNRNGDVYKINGNICKRIFVAHGMNVMN